MKFAILDDFQGAAASLPCMHQLRGCGELVAFRQPLSSPAQIIEALKDVQILIPIRERTQLAGPVLEALPNLEMISQTGGNTPHLDLEAATRRGIVVCTSQGSGQSTAELTFALMLAVMRHIPQEHQALRAGQWQTSQGTGLQGKTLGIIGLGRIGSRVAHIAQAFGMRVLATGFTLTAERALAHGVRMAALEDLLARSDVVSIHLRLSDRSHKLIGRRELRLMKPTAYLINTARGPIVDEAALIDALRHHRIAGAGLDVFEQEPIQPSHPLLQLDNVVCTPHIGFVTRETYEQMLGGAVENILNYLDGNPTNVRNPQALTQRLRH
ncbi:MAG: D-2-hydroxyacid dehydrogenase family protein [Candidatus Tectomicrobia bacterium]|jgi:phosphoglycerate dehydrogenase-like enzyme|nr:D-2-hydroxyacid dehydrogenase family protein [Candidatus Tectomicrobia bacterium]